LRVSSFASNAVMHCIVFMPSLISDPFPVDLTLNVRQG